MGTIRTIVCSRNVSNSNKNHPRTKDNQNNMSNLTPTEKLLFIALTGACLTIMGMNFNFQVMTHNQGRMPVLADFEYEDNKYFTYSSSEDVPYEFFADNIPAKFAMFSIGDIFIILGLTIINYGLIRFLYVKRIEYNGRA